MGKHPLTTHTEFRARHEVCFSLDVFLLMLGMQVVAGGAKIGGKCTDMFVSVSVREKTIQ